MGNLLSLKNILEDGNMPILELAKRIYLNDPSLVQLTIYLRKKNNATDLKRTLFRKEELPDLMHYLAYNKYIKKLNFRFYNYKEDKFTFSELIEILNCFTEFYINNTNVKLLDFSYCGLNNECINSILNGLSLNKGITKLRLYDNLITAEGAKAIADFISMNKRLTFIDLGKNNIDDDGFVSILEALKTNVAISKLYVDECNLTRIPQDKHFEYIAGEPHRKIYYYWAKRHKFRF